MKRREFLKSMASMAAGPFFYNPESENKSVKITFGGDVCLSSPQRKPNHDNFESVMENLKNKEGNQIMYSYCFNEMQDIFNDSDLVMVNLECPITESKDLLPKKFNFKANPDYVNILKIAGIDIVTLANNHIMDFSSKGVEDTTDLLDSVGIGYVGAGTNLERARIPKILNIKGFDFGFLGYSRIGPSSIFASSSRAGTANLDEKIYCEDIIELRKQVDFLIVNIHWGVERDFYPADYQKHHGRNFIDYGADVVIGHHPHVVQPIEKYKDGLIFYSLGNFMFGGNSTRSLNSITETFTPTLSFSSQDINYHISPIRITSHEKPYQPFEHNHPERITKLLSV